MERKTLLEAISYYNASLAKSVGIGHSKGTVTKFKTLQVKVLKFLSVQLHRKDVLLKELNHEFIVNFDYSWRRIRRSATIQLSSIFRTWRRSLTWLLLMVGWIEILSWIKIYFSSVQFVHFIGKYNLYQYLLVNLKTDIHCFIWWKPTKYCL